MSVSNISGFYSGHNVLITGGTGFLGKVLLEKLIRSCPDIGTVYVVIRPKKGLDVHERLDALLKAEIFKTIHSDALEKVVAIEGDLCKPFLGISEVNIDAILNGVSVVFHSAASVKFDEPLRCAVETNLIGTQRVLELCHEIKHLVALIHVSTAFSNCDNTHIEEKIYPSYVKPKQIINAMEWMDDDTANSITPTLLRDKPNTYTYTKALAEVLLSEDGKQLPIAIIRPSIVGASWKEPMPGWIDNYNGPTGTMLAISSGLLRSLLIDLDRFTDIVPVDIVVNMMIAAAWYTAAQRSENILVYNCVSRPSNPLTWCEFWTFFKEITQDVPMENRYRNVYVAITKFKLIHYSKVFINHLVPAVILDFFSLACGKSPRLLKMYQKLHKVMDSLEFFRTNDWTFTANNCNHLWAQMSSKDQAKYNFSCSELDWSDYLRKYHVGIKVFLMNEDMNNVVKAQRRHTMKNIVKFVIKLTTSVFIVRLLIRKSSAFHALWYFVIKMALDLYKLCTLGLK
ncbi:FAR2 (predicted) [Pycnogonum litorale]